MNKTKNIFYCKEQSSYKTKHEQAIIIAQRIETFEVPVSSFNSSMFDLNIQCGHFKT